MVPEMTEEDLAFFKSRRGYYRIFKGIRDKYKSLGRIGGIVKLVNLTDDEREVLSNHFKRDYSRSKSASIDVSAFEQSLKHTRFEGYSLLEILEAYFGEKITSKKEDLDNYQTEKEKFFKELYLTFEGRESAKWIQSICEGKAVGVRAINRRYDRDKDALKKDIALVCNAIDSLPVYSGEKMRFSVFASRITRNPHGFDIGTECGNMFKWALCTVMGTGEVKGPEEIAELYYRAGILIDEVSNYVTLSGLIAYKKGVPDAVFEAAYHSSQVLQVPLLQLSKIDDVRSPVNKVYVVENPEVFAELLDTCQKRENRIPPLVCTFGQPKLSSLVLLDMLYKNKTKIYYSGDFDPEGLSIADRLYKRYQGYLYLWRYSVDDYEKALSDEMINAKRLSLLKGIKAEELKIVAKKMAIIKKAGYQELLIQELISDLLE